jgi:hypothetical protein
VVAVCVVARPAESYRSLGASRPSISGELATKDELLHHDAIIGERIIGKSVRAIAQDHGCSILVDARVILPRSAV